MRSRRSAGRGTWGGQYYPTAIRPAVPIGRKRMRTRVAYTRVFRRPPPPHGSCRMTLSFFSAGDSLGGDVYIYYMRTVDYYPLHSRLFSFHAHPRLRQSPEHRASYTKHHYTSLLHPLDSALGSSVQMALDSGSCNFIYTPQGVPLL